MIIEPIDDDFEKQIEDLSDKEIVAFRSHQKTYEIKYPPPKRGSPSPMFQFWFWSTVVSCIAAIGLNAFRTGDAFYQAAVSLNAVLRWIEVLFAVLGVDGVVVLFAIRNAYSTNKVNENSAFWGLAMAVLISSVAGLFQSANILKVGDAAVSGFVGLTVFLRWSLVILMGLGSTAIAWFSGDLVGVQLVRRDQEMTKLDSELSTSLKGYHARLMKEWKSSFELVAVNERKGSRYRSDDRERSPRTNTNEPVRSERSRTNAPNGNVEISNMLDAVLQSESRIAGVSEIARKIAADRSETKSDADFARYKGIVSETRKQWMIDRGFIDQNGQPVEHGVDRQN